MLLCYGQDGEDMQTAIYSTGFDVHALKMSMSKGTFLSLADLVPRGSILSQLSQVTFFFFYEGSFAIE